MFSACEFAKVAEEGLYRDRHGFQDDHTVEAEHERRYLKLLSRPRTAISSSATVRSGGSAATAVSSSSRRSSQALPRLLSIPQAYFEPKENY